MCFFKKNKNSKNSAKDLNEKSLKKVSGGIAAPVPFNKEEEEIGSCANPVKFKSGQVTNPHIISKKRNKK